MSEFNSVSQKIDPTIITSEMNYQSNSPKMLTLTLVNSIPTEPRFTNRLPLTNQISIPNFNHTPVQPVIVPAPAYTIGMAPTSPIDTEVGIPSCLKIVVFVYPEAEKSAEVATKLPSISTLKGASANFDAPSHMPD